MKYEKEFRLAKPETIGETDMAFDIGNYVDWLECEHETLKQVKHNVDLSNVSEFLIWLMNEPVFNIPKDEIKEILDDWITYKSNSH